jgi:pimeloyl-ACP methyl ester carboxylesterase
MKAILFLVFTIWVYQSYGQTIDTFSTLKTSKIFYHKTGTGKPAVVFVSGLGEDHKTWQSIQDSLSSFTLTISYDRAGLGASEYNGEKKDLYSLAMELEQILASASISKPFILVGHSLGCQIIKDYASLFPKNVASLVFLDPGYNEQKLRARLPDSIWQKRAETLQKYLPRFNAAQQAELDNLNSNCELADKIITLPKVPIVLFTATQINPDFPGSITELMVKRETHRLWLQSLPWAKQIEVAHSRHYIQNDVPDIVIEVVHSMLIAVSKKSKTKN